MSWRHSKVLRLYASLREGQANVIAVILLVGASLAVGVAIVALFTSQAAVISSQEDVSDAVNAAAADEFVTLVYHSYIPADPNDPSAGYNHTFIFKLVLLSYGARDYFLVVPLITFGSPPSIYVEGGPTLQLWGGLNVSYLKVQVNSTDYVPVVLNPQNVSGDNVLLTPSGLSLKSFGLSKVPIYRVPTLNTTPYPSAYVMVKFTAPPDWEDYDFTFYTLIQIGPKFYGVERISTPLGGGT